MVTVSAAASKRTRESWNGAPAVYSLYGLTVASDIPLHGSELPGSQHPDIVIRCVDTVPPPINGEPVRVIPCDFHGTDMREYRRPDGTWIWLREFGTFHLDPSIACISVYPDPAIDLQSLSVAITGPILLYARHRRGRPSLHASAVVTPHGAVGFLGDRGEGKSTIASIFLRRGASLLGDDALPLEAGASGVAGLPGPGFMKLWKETARHALALFEPLPDLMPDVEKKYVSLEGRYPQEAEPVPIRALFVLSRYEPTGRTDASIHPLGARDALFALLRHTSVRAYLTPQDDAVSLPLYTQLISQAPVRVLRYPTGFDYQDSIHTRVLEDMVS